MIRFIHRIGHRKGLSMCRSFRTALFAVACLTAVAAAQPARPHAPAHPVEAQAQGVLDDLAASGDFAAARKAADDLLDRTLAHLPLSDTGSFITAARTHRLVHQLSRYPGAKAVALLQFLQQHEELAEVLAFVIRPEDNPAEVYAALDALRAVHGDKLGEYANLTAALCVVHDRPLRVRINENEPAAPPIADLFDYYTKNERRMVFGIKRVPAELLVWVVDSTASIEEMQWALGKYAGTTDVGRLFFTIRYDMDYLRTGGVKPLTAAGFNLANILKCGGVCADQAYFAVAVGKAIGVPTAYATAQNGQVGHAWVGYLQAGGRSARWNFKEGRYEAYRGIKGNVLDPQTRKIIADSNVSLLAELIGSKTADRHTAAALTDAADRMAVLAVRGGELAPEPLVAPGDGRKASPPVSLDVAGQLRVIETGLRACPGYARGWEAVARRAANGGLATSDKMKWCDLLLRLCGKSYPDFAMAVLRPMIRTVDDVAKQHQIWESLFRMMRGRNDLAAEVRITQGELWESQGDVRKAGTCYHDVITRFANDGPFVLDALSRTAKMLGAAGKADRIPALYESTWRKLDKPQRIAGVFREQSNWYRVGMQYVAALRFQGDIQKAEAVQAEIDKEMGT